jgi:hypothetical protein
VGQKKKQGFNLLDIWFAKLLQESDKFREYTYLVKETNLLKGTNLDGGMFQSRYPMLRKNELCSKIVDEGLR